jgi:hypothetical protein
MFFFQGTGMGSGIRNTIGNFFPIGGDTPINGTGGIDEPAVVGEPSPITGEFIPILRRVSTAPAAGYTSFDRATTTKTIVNGATTTITINEMVIRYVEKATGHVYESSEYTLNVPRISNTTLGIFDTVSFSNPLSFVARKFNPDSSLIDTYIGSLVKNGTTTSTTTLDYRTTGSYFPRHPDAIAVRGTSLFSLYEHTLNSEGYLTQITPIKEVKVFSSQLSGWNVEWINKDNLLLTTKPNSGYDGYAYSYNPTTKKMTEIFGRKSGLTAKVNSTITAGLYSESYEDSFAFYMANLTKGTFFQLSSATLPEKCVFSVKNPMIAYCAVPRPLSAGSYPEDWYKGKVQFDDAIVKIDLEKNTETTLVNLYDESAVSIDAINLTLNDKETYLMFQNKRDDYVWSYDLQ